MADAVTFLPPSIPKFDGFYDHWAELMENLLRSKDLWSLIETGIIVAPENPTPEQTLAAAESRLKDLKVKNYLFQSIDRSILETILDRSTSRQIWESMRQKFQGSNRVKRAQLQTLRREFEVLWMKEDESVNDFFSRTLVIANKMTAHGESLDQSQIVEKILRSMSAKFEYVVCSIEQSCDTTTMSIDELQSSLLVHEGRMNHHKAKQEEQALKITNLGRGNGNSRGRGRNSSRGCGRGRNTISKEHVECYKCHKLGHYQNECPTWEENANFAYEFNEHEEILLMTQQHTHTNTSDQVWFVDSGCSNHMIGTKEWLFNFDDKFRETVKLGDNSTMQVMGKGNVKLYLAGQVTVISDVYYLTDLKNNLLSIGQLQQKNLTIVFSKDVCKIFHEGKGLIVTTQMTVNRMYGHLSFKGLNTLAKREMVKGLPMVKDNQTVCSDYICGPINPTSNGGSKYFITFTDDLTRKTWTYPLKDKASAFDCFKKFKALIEKESDCTIKCLRTDRGGEFTSSKFNEFCSEHGIKRQLTAAYTPQQNGVSERKNKTLLNMVRSMLVGKYVPKLFWPEAVVWATYVINRSPTLSVKDVTPEEAWSGTKPSVSHFKIFGCIGYVHVPEAQRKKLDPKGIKCVHLGVSEESKAYQLYDPIQKKIIISRDLEEETISEYEQETTPEIDDQGINIENEQGHEETEEDNDSDEGNNGATRQLPPRTRNPPGWVHDYVTNLEDSDIDQMQNLVVFCDNSDPHTYEEASKMAVWRKAMDQEIEFIERNDTWELVTLSREAKRISVKWIFKTKYNENGEIEKYKARLVAKGYSQQHGIDFNEVFAPVARWDTIRTILAVAASQGWFVYQFDVKSAFLHGELQENVYIDQPPGYGRGDGMVYKLKKALYGLKQAPRAWYSKIESYFVQENFVKCPHEHTLFVKQDKDGSILIVSLYVDDLIFTGNNEAMFESFKKSMKSQFAMTDLGKMRYMERPTEIHLAAAKRVLRYLKGSLDFGILYKTNCELTLEGWSDSDYAGDLDDRKNTSGYVFMIGSSPISWSSKKQTIVTLSTTEAEYVSAASCACQAIWLRRILEQLKQPQGCTTIQCDNISSIKLSKNPRMVDDQMADIMTKALKLDLFSDLRNRLAICSRP
ncbi:hypothetical protein TSUD_311720 [Trifolium subterraneum]|uniref:Integrase catalytic domain-containing protein n=1 Tax=Trifolium subterraneum TaxID=3900 RepID=A0A2Z6N6U0_TRISU|nr:hypothetical protein TSUD_311720 [Trifolium subterraneum]